MLGSKILSNTAARIWVTLLNFAFVPLYIRYLGIEAYGLIGFFATMQGLFSVLDLGPKVRDRFLRLTAHPNHGGGFQPVYRALEDL